MFSKTDKRGGPRKQTEREKKKKILSERRKELNVEAMNAEMLRYRAARKDPHCMYCISLCPSAQMSHNYAENDSKKIFGSTV